MMEAEKETYNKYSGTKKIEIQTLFGSKKNVVLEGDGLQSQNQNRRGERKEEAIS